MSTRSFIMYKDYETENYRGIYCHHDGYYNHVGRILAGYYNSYEKAKALVELGDISSLNETLETCDAYCRDHNEDLHIYEDRGYDVVNDYSFVYMFRNGVWRVYENGMWMPLTAVLEREKIPYEKEPIPSPTEDGLTLTDLSVLCRGKFLNLYVADYTSANGTKKPYEIVSRRPLARPADISKQKADAVTVICYNKDKTKMLLQQEFRMTVNGFVWDLPSGLIDEGETPAVAAARELKEETGLDCLETLMVCPACYTSVGMTNEMIVPVYCIADGEITGSDNELEITKPRWFTKEEARKLFEDSKKAFENDKPYVGLTNRTSAELYRWAYEI